MVFLLGARYWSTSISLQMKVLVRCALHLLVLHIWSADLNLSPVIVLSQSLF